MSRVPIADYALLTERLGNYPGFPESLSGADFANRLAAEARRFAVELPSAEAVSISVDGQYRVVPAVKWRRGSVVCGPAGARVSVVMRYPATHEPAELQLAAVFLFIGQRPYTAFLNASVDVDEAGSCCSSASLASSHSLTSLPVLLLGPWSTSSQRHP